MENIKLDVYELDAAVRGDHEEYKVAQHIITGTFRHGNMNIAILQRVADGKFFKVPYKDSIKEECEFETLNSDGEYGEVVPEERITTVYVPAS